MQIGKHLLLCYSHDLLEIRWLPVTHWAVSDKDCFHRQQTLFCADFSTTLPFQTIRLLCQANDFCHQGRQMLEPTLSGCPKIVFAHLNRS